MNELQGERMIWKAVLKWNRHKEADSFTNLELELHVHTLNAY